MWTYLSLNPYGVKVEENENGIRRFQINGDWKEETNETIHVCRISDSEDLKIISNAMSYNEISKSYDHSAEKCALIWFTPKGYVTKINDNTMNKVKNNQKYITLKKMIENEIGKRIVLLWMNNQDWSNELPKWNNAIKMRSPTLNRGVQIGVSKILKAKFKNELWTEIGLISSSDSSSWALSSEKRQIYAAKVDTNIKAPYAIQSQYMIKYTPKKKISENKGFSAKFAPQYQTSIKEDFFDIYTSLETKKILWLTERSLKTFGEDKLMSWKLWFCENETEGIIVFENREIEKMFNIYTEIESKGIHRYQIMDGENLSAIVSVISLNGEKKKEVVSLSDFAGSHPPLRNEELSPVADEFGRVPYRALSKISEPVGMIPKRLEENIHQALVNLGHEWGNVDREIAKLMNFKKKELVNYISAEQVDAIALFVNAFKNKEDAILADETGFGKGRVLASLVKIGLKMKKTVIFITENAQLFTDFYRDLTDVYGEDDVANVIPEVLHGNAKIFNQKGELVKKIMDKTKPYEEMMKRKKFAKKETSLIFTTYSQINKENKKGSNKKVEWLKQIMKNSEDGCWMILDESHNAAGDSNVNSNLEYLQKYSDGCLYSSATYAKTEANLSLYKKALNMPSWLYVLCGNAIENDNGSLRETITTSMAKKGNFIRREHKPIDPPKITWIDLDEENEKHLTNFSKFWSKFHDLIAQRETMVGGFYGESWAKIGGHLSRSVKEFSLLMKVDSHIESVVQSLEKGQKPFIALESTFESAFRSVLEDSIEDEEDTEVFEDNNNDNEDKEKQTKKKKSISLTGMIVDHIPTWKERLELIVNKTLDIEDFKENNENPNDLAIILEEKKALMDILEKFPNWDLMPIERILNGVKNSGYNVGELSGRMYSYEKTDDGKFVIKLRPKVNRVDLVKDINNGTIDFAIITLAGCTGISVHAGRKFKDQKQRVLYEGDIAVNTSKRIQFWGRVRRKDQVNEPEFKRLALNILSEKRVQAREDKKREKLAAHVGMKQDFEDISWISNEGEEIVEEWAFDRKRYAGQIGVSKPIENSPVGRVDRALLRSIILPIEEQEELLNRLDRGLELVKQVAHKEKNVNNIKKSRKVRSHWLLGHPTRNSEDTMNSMKIPKINFSERVCEKSEPLNYEKMVDYIKVNNHLEIDGSVVLEKWKNVWADEYRYKNMLNKDFQSEVLSWITQKLPNCKRGTAVRILRPGESDKTYGVVLGFDIPEEKAMQRGASKWALSQVAIKLWLVGENEPIKMPLLKLYKDGFFEAEGKPMDMQMFKREFPAQTFISIEGNPILSSYWCKIWKVGSPMITEDSDEGIMWVWRLPKLWDWDAMKNLPKIALNVKQINNFLCYKNHKKDHYITALMEKGKFLTAKNNGSSIEVSVDHNTFNEAISGWANPSNRKLFENINRKAKIGKNTPCTTFYINYKFLMRIFNSMEKNGIMWMMQNCSDEWYSEDSALIMNSVITEDDKILNKVEKKNIYQKKTY